MSRKLNTGQCPYSSLPQTSFWRQSVAEQDYSNVKPQLPSTFKIGRSDKIASAGSCFAQHIASHLKEAGFAYLNMETGEHIADSVERQRQGYSLYSARFGNIYSSRQLLQLLQRSVLEFETEESYWTKDGRWYDPFRPNIVANGFASLEEIEADRKTHLQAVRKLFESMDVFIFTLGLAEIWYSKIDGAVFPTCPGCGLGEFDPKRYGFLTLTSAEIEADLDSFVNLLAEINPSARVIFTVSPVPLVATFCDKHVIEATTLSKASLRVAVDGVVNRHEQVHYFGSFDIITNARRSDYFEADLRSITPVGVSHVMREFFDLFSEPEKVDDIPPSLAQNSTMTSLDIVCDEDYLMEALAKVSSSTVPQKTAQIGDINRKLQPIIKTQEIFAMGDSHCLPLRGAIIGSEQEQAPLLVSSKYIEGFSGQTFLQADGSFNEELMSEFRSRAFVDSEGLPTWKKMERNSISEWFTAGRPLTTPIIIVFCGDIDLRGHIFAHFKDIYDFDLPELDMSARDGSHYLPLDAVTDLIDQHLKPVIDGMVRLYQMGLSRSFLSMLPPPSLSDEASFEDSHGFRCPLSVRVKLTYLANRMLADNCAIAKISFLDIADKVGSDGQLMEKYRLDGFHMTTEAGMHLVTKAMEIAHLNSVAHVNTTIYSHATENHEPPETSTTTAYLEASAEFSKQHLLLRPTNHSELIEAISSIDFDDDVGNKLEKLSWYGPGRRSFNLDMRSATPDVALMNALYDYTYHEDNLPLFEAACKGSPYVINARFFMSLPHVREPVGPQTFHTDSAPPGLYRALLYLTDVHENSGPFEYKDENGKPIPVTGPSGTLTIFDANALTHRGRLPKIGLRKVVDITFAARPRGMQKQVCWASTNAWPLDPYQYATDGMFIFPPTDSEWHSLYPFT